MQERSFAAKYLSHIGTERNRGEHNKSKDKGDLRPADKGHEVTAESEAFRPQKREDQIAEEKGGRGPAEDHVEHNGLATSDRRGVCRRRTPQTPQYPTPEK